MKIPPYLQPGDKVAVVCPASYIKGDIEIGVKTLESWGLTVQIGSSVTSQFHQFAGEDSLRASDLQQALDNPEIKAIIAGRGGYGSVRIIDNLDFNQFTANPKWLVGFSDITVIHSHIQRQFGIPTIHGQMAKSFADSTFEALETLKNALFGKPMDITYANNDFPNRSGESEGILIGGNLAILQSILASVSDAKYDGKILFIEDVGESHYNVDRMLWTLKRADKFNNLKGLIVGGFTSLRDSEPPFGQRFEEIIMDKVNEFDFPIAFGFPAGHITDNRALVLGGKIKLNVEGTKVSLTYLS
ncbi:S66 peptidase family protein [Sphingobacterium lumbrici]|uniref:S66 peptidase family protein n=1 Tax=Sphingobacterium lumbrici TaxID=2559600 RepID=UPI00112D6DBB|nr:LD-carboxypeptidase [Sphingobacterium lumbrici]